MRKSKTPREWKDRRDEERSYRNDLDEIGKKGEKAVKQFLQREYDKVKYIGSEGKKKDFRCHKNGETTIVEAKHDTKIKKTGNLPWEPFRLEEKGQKMYISWGWNTKAKLVIFYLENVEVKGKKRDGLLIMNPQGIRSVIWNSYYKREKFKKEFGENEFRITRAYTNNDRLTFIFLVPVDVLWEKNLINMVIIGTPFTKRDEKLFINSLGS